MFLFLAIAVVAQSRIVDGKLVAYFIFPVQNIEVMAKEAKSIIKSDSLGQFSILCYPHDFIKIKAKGFHAVTRQVEPATDSVFINLVFANSKKNREIVIANGNISENDLLHAVGHLDHVNNDFGSYTDIFKLIKDQFSSELVVSGNKIYVKRQQIDYSEEEYETLGFPQVKCRVDGSVTNDIDFIKPCNIKSICLNNSTNLKSDWSSKEIVILTRNSDYQ